MIKQIKPNSLSHKFLSLIFEKHEIRRGINICDVPWRALKQLVFVTVVTVLLTLLASLVVLYTVGFVLMLFSPFFQYSLPFVALIKLTWCFSVAMVGISSIMAPIICFSEGWPIMPKWLKKKSSDKPPSPPSLISIWWKSFKEKTCVKIVVDSEDMMEGK